MKLLFFASFRQLLGKGEETLSKPPGVATVADLVNWLKAEDEIYAEIFSDPDRVKVAVNQTYVTAEQPVADTDEVAFFPPVTGG